MTFNDSHKYFSLQATSTQVFNLKNLAALAKYCSMLILPRTTAPQFAKNHSFDSHTLNDVGLNSHQVSYRMMLRELVE
jgi:hypothetical protein